MPRVLLLEDNAIDAHLIERTLVDEGIQAEFSIAENRAEYLRRLDQGSVDLIISDSGVPWLTALEALQISKKRQPHASFLIVSGGMDEQGANIAKQAGAIEWIPKSELKKLPSIARLALDAAIQARNAAQLKDENVQLSAINRSMQRLIAAISELAQAHSLPEIQTIVRHAARDLNGADGATFVLRDNHECFYADEDAIGPLWKGQRFPLSNCISGWTMLNKQAAVVPDIALDPRISLDAYKSTFVKSMLMVPIRKDSPIGAIGNYWATPHLPTDAEVACIQALADATSIALANLDIYHQWEARVAERSMQLQEANQSLQEFSHFVSHDLRAPVRSIGAFAQLLEKELQNTLQPQTPTQRALSSIKSSTVSMQAMLDSLLALAQSGTATIDNSNIDMTALAEDAAHTVTENHLHAHEFQGKTPQIQIMAMPKIAGSAVLLRQVWINLLTNAIKFSSRHAAAHILIGAENTEGETWYFVRDNDAGFDMTHAEHEFPGASVGLAIVQRIVTRHGGRVWTESKPDEGATFYFAFPKNDALLRHAYR